MPTIEETKKQVKNFILTEFLPGEDPEELTTSTPLMTGGILDSLATLKLVDFLERNYRFEIEAHEVNEDNLGSIESITRFVHSKIN